MPKAILCSLLTSEKKKESRLVLVVVLNERFEQDLHPLFFPSKVVLVIIVFLHLMLNIFLLHSCWVMCCLSTNIIIIIVLVRPSFACMMAMNFFLQHRFVLFPFHLREPKKKYLRKIKLKLNQN